MKLTFRAKLMLIVGAAAVAFVLVILVSTLIGIRETRQLADIEGRLVPKLALGPGVDAEFEHLWRAMQDAVAAQDLEALTETRPLRDHLLGSLGAAEVILGAGQTANIRGAVEDYYDAALGVSRRMIRGEQGEGVVEAIAAMQAKHNRVAVLLRQGTHLEGTELADGFAVARDASARAARWRLTIGLGCFAIVLILSLWLSGGVLRSLALLSEGLTRFGKGDFSHRMTIASRDELGTVAREANQMADNLARLAVERDRNDWLRTGQSKLAEALRGDLDPQEIGALSVRLLASYVGAPAGALYIAAEADVFRLGGRYGLSDGGAAQPAPLFRTGEALVGQAAAQTEILVVENPPADYLRVRSGLGEGSPRAIVLLPLVHFGKVTGVLELALFKPCTDEIHELLLSIRESLAIALEVARSRVTTRELLAETRRQADRLSNQEQELAASNEELQTQQEELRQANEELEQQRHALEERNEELERARHREKQKADALSEASAYKSQFLANMSHELRTPLNSMLLLSRLLADNTERNLSPKQVEFCGTIHSAGRDLLALINQVLDLSKIESGKQEVVLEEVQLAEVAERARRVFTPMAADKGLEFLVEVDPALPETIVTDHQRIDQILTNLLGNALKFTQRGRVTLTMGRAPDAARLARTDLPAAQAIAIAVSDTGIGIPPEEQERVFAPFQQLDARTDRRYGGTGLGLAIARELALLLGGELQLESAPGRGSTFTLFLHAKLTATARPAAALPSRGAGGWDPPGGGGAARLPAGDTAGPQRPPSDDRADLAPHEPYLLVVEDDTVFAEQLVEIIHARRFKVLVASSGEEALRLAKQHRPQGIILDVKLPDIDGWTVMERLGTEADTRGIPVHFASSLDAPERGLAMGAVGYLTKPASREALIAAVETLAPQTIEGSRQILVVEDDTQSGESLVRRLEGEGLQARFVQTGSAALEALAHDRFSCIVLDLGLPDMDGLGFLELLHARKNLETPPVVVYTGRALTKDETRRIEDYAEAVVLKEGRSTERLLEEIRLFIQHLKGRLPRDRDRHGVRRDRTADVQLVSKKILVVDDDMRTVYALSALLRAKGADVLVAETGCAALAVLDEHLDVAGVLMDVMMPEMDGYEAMRRIRGDPRLQALPVIALTAKAMKGERERCLEAGASDYLAKPIDADQLMAMLHRWLNLERSHAPRPRG